MRKQRNPVRPPCRHGRLGFTLVELLIVIAIILLVTVVALPAIYSSLNGRQITDAARIFTGALVGIRDSAIKYNSPRGIRLLPDPVLTIPAPGQPGAGSQQLCYNRMIAIEPAGDYSEGRVTIGPYYPSDTPPTAGSSTFPPQYPMPAGTTSRYPHLPSSDPSLAAGPRVLMVEESPYVGGFVSVNAQPNSPTNWYWNIRLGDKLKLGGTGRSYTVVGPCTINPWTTVAANRGNPELYCNVGEPGALSPLLRTYYQVDVTGTVPVVGAPWPTPTSPRQPEFLFLVNGEDDDTNGYVDEGWDGFDNNANLSKDETGEWETEKWLGSVSTGTLADVADANGRPSFAWATAHFRTGVGTQDVPYIIERRPVPSQGAREVMLPAGMVIDATTWDSTKERSRIPVSLGSLYSDIMVNPNGLYIPTTEYSSPTSAQAVPFLHFWLTSRDDVHPRGSVWGLTGTTPNPNPSNTATATYFELPLPANAMGLTAANYPAGGAVPFLKGERRLVTMFTQSGLVVSNQVESIPPVSGYQTGEGFSALDLSYPFQKAQQGSRDVR